MTFYLANDGQNHLYRNDGDGTFTSMTSADVGPIVSTQGNSWGAAWADYDNDGFLDAIVINAAFGGNPGSLNALYHNTGLERESLGQHPRGRHRVEPLGDRGRRSA